MVLSSEFWFLGFIIDPVQGSGFKVCVWVLCLGSRSEFWFWVSRSAIDHFWFINGIPAIIQGSSVLVIAKGLLKGSPIFFKAGGLTKCLINGSLIVVLHYV